MQVTVHYFAQLRRATGCTAESVDVEPGSTIAVLCGQVGATHGDAVRALLLQADGSPHLSLLVFIGEQPAEPDHVLRDGEEVTILTPMAGG